MAILLSSLKTEFGLTKKDISDVSNDLFVTWCNYLVTAVYDKLVNTSPDKLFAVSTISAVSGTASYALPADFGTINTIGSGIFPVDSTGNAISDPLPLTGYGSPNAGYYISDGNIVLTPIPSAGATYKLRYIPTPPTFTATSDYFTVDKLITGKAILDQTESEYIIRALDVQYCIWDEDLNMEPIADMRFVRALSEMLKRNRVTPGSFNIYSYNASY